MSDAEAIMREALDGHRYRFGADRGDRVNFGEGHVVIDTGPKARIEPDPPPPAPMQEAPQAEEEPEAPPMVRPTCADVLRVVARETRIKIEEIRSESRAPRLVHARHMFFYVARKLTGQSLPQIGRACGGRDHSTVHHGVVKVERSRHVFEPQLERIMAKMGRCSAVDYVDNCFRGSVHGANRGCSGE